MVNRHTRVCVTPETDFMYMLSRYPDGSKGFQRDWPRSLHSILGRVHPTAHWTDLDNLVYAHVAGRPTNGKDTFLALGEIISDRYGKRLWLEKTPNHILCLPYIRQLFPDAPIIHIIRDGRDVAESLTKVRFGSLNFFENLVGWRDAVSAARQFGDSDDRYLCIRYEDLVADPSATLKVVCGFLGVRFEERMLAPDGSESALIDRTGTHMDQAAAPIDRSRLEGWLRNLSATRQNAAAAFVGEELACYGYRLPDEAHQVTQNIVINKNIVLGKSCRALYDSLIETSVATWPNSAIIEFDSMFEIQPNRKTCLIITDEVPLPRASSAKLFSGIVFALRLFTKLFAVRLHSSKVVWIFKPTAATANRWPLKRVCEIMMATMSNIVVVDGAEASATDEVLLRFIKKFNGIDIQSRGFHESLLKAISPEILSDVSK